MVEDLVNYHPRQILLTLRLAIFTPDDSLYLS